MIASVADSTPFSIRPADRADIAALTTLIERSARDLSVGHYSPIQVEAALGGAFGVDSQLIADGTYFVVHPTAKREHIIAAGGWSFRCKLFGGDKRASVGAEDRLDPATDAAKIRAFFVDPAHTRQGLGRRLIAHCEADARRRSFSRFTLMSTLPGVALYRACGYQPDAAVTIALDTRTSISFVPMHKNEVAI